MRNNTLKPITGIVASLIVALTVSAGRSRTGDRKSHALRGFSDASAAVEIGWEEKNASDSQSPSFCANT